MAEKATSLRVVNEQAGVVPFGYPRMLTEPDVEGGLGLREYWNILWRNKWLLLLATVLGATLGMYKASSQVPLYRASVTILVEPDLSQLASSKGAIVFPNLHRFYETQYELLRSRVVASKVVDRLKLDENSSKVPVTGDESWLDWLREKTGFSSRPKVTNLAQTRSRESLIGAVQRGISVQGGERSQLAKVSFSSPDPEFAAHAANTLVDVYIDLGLESKEDRARQASNWLAQRLEDLNKQLRDSENTLRQYQQREGLVDLKQVEQLGTSNLSSLNSRYLSAQTRYAELSKRYGPKHPKLVEAKNELAEAKRRLDSISKSIVGSKEKEFELAKLEREVESNKQLYNIFLEKFKETDLSSDYKISNTRIIDRARVPSAPYAPDRQRIVMLWAGVGFILGVILIFLRHQLDNKFRSTKQVEEVLSLPVLGVMPYLTKSRRQKRKSSKSRREQEQSGDVFPERHFIREIRSGFAEAVNHIRTGILYSNVDHPPRIVLITSALQGEGKTTLATNLALSYSQLDRTLLVDADLRKPRVHESTGLSSSVGLVEYVAGVNQLKECIVQDRESPNLYVLNSGVIPPNPLELLSSERLRQTLEELKSKFGHIVIDTAPVLPVSDAIVLGHIVDAVVLVIQADRTTHKAVTDSLDRLRNSNVSPMGAVLTQVNAARKSDYGYSGRYDYYYSGYYGKAKS